MLNPKEISVLIVDDNDISRSMLRHILHSESFSAITEAAGGVPALDWLTRNRAHLVCLDIMMPDIDGITILQHIKQNYPETIVLMVTGDNKRDIVMRAVNGGADGFIIKPFNPSTLIGAIHASLRKNSREPIRQSQATVSFPFAKPVSNPASVTPTAATVSVQETKIQATASSEPAKPVRYYPDR